MSEVVRVMPAPKFFEEHPACRSPPCGLKRLGDLSRVSLTMLLQNMEHLCQLQHQLGGWELAQTPQTRAQPNGIASSNPVIRPSVWRPAPRLSPSPRSPQ